ncbi:MAG: sulfite exporter TauE/SafE family protein [Actinomycetota bacterium]|nr:sulfite exporter TauE/SafE family protein [Actinomycetota bacterium]
MSGWQALAVFVAGIWAGTINTVVGSGTLVSFPVLLAVGLPPVSANVTNTLGLAAGSLTGAVGYRRELAGQWRRVGVLGAASLLGGLTGAILLLTLPAGAFRAIVPVLIVIAVVMVVAQPRLAAILARRHQGTHRTAVTPLLWLLVLATAVYGGYFGAAQGVILIAVMAVLLDDDLQRINGMKNVLAFLANAVAAALFVFIADVDWAAAGLVAAGSILGGLLGARIGRRLSPVALRTIIVVVGLAAIAKLLL